METSTPVFPNGRFGTAVSPDPCVDVPASAAVADPIGPSADPKPAAPTALMNARLDRMVFIVVSPYFNVQSACTEWCPLLISFFCNRRAPNRTGQVPCGCWLGCVSYNILCRTAA